MRTHEAATASLRDRNVLLKVTVDGTEITNLAGRDWVESFSYSENVDQAVVDAELTLAREEYALSLAPLKGDSKFNAVTPLLHLTALVVVSVSEAPNRAAADAQGLWHEAFRGRVDSIDWGSNPLRLRLRDLAADVQDAWSKLPRAYAIGKQNKGVLIWNKDWMAGRTVSLGTLIIPSTAPSDRETYVYVCIQAGQIGVTEPTWPVDASAVTDGTVQWARAFSGVSTWTPSYAWASGDTCKPTALGPHRYICTQAGTSGSSEPTWPTSIGVSVDDGTARWAMLPDGSDGGIPVESVMQGILNDNTAGLPDIWVPASPGYWHLPWNMMQGSVLEALRNLASEIGWDVRLRYNPAASEHGTWGRWRLCFYLPDRAKTGSDATFSADDYMDVRRCGSVLATIRNDIEVAYSDSQDTPWPDGNLKRKFVNVEDATSIAKYGRRFMALGEGTTNSINTTTEATALANAVLADLKDPLVELEIECPYRWWCEIGDLYTFTANDVHFTADQKLAVVGLAHTLEGGQTSSARTTIQVRGKPTAGVQRWLERGSDLGRPVLASAVRGPSVTVAQAAIAGGTVTIAPPPNLGPVPAVTRGGGWSETELHLSTNSGFTPSASTLAAKTKGTRFDLAGLSPGTTYYLKCVSVDAKGNRSAPSAQSSIVPRYVEPADLLPRLRTAVSVARGSSQTSMTKTDKIVFNSIAFDEGGNWNTDTGEFSAVAGLYQLRACANIGGLITGDTAQLVLKRDGVTILTGPPFRVYGNDLFTAAYLDAMIESTSVDRGDEVWAVHLSCTTSQLSVSVSATGSRVEVTSVIAR